MMNTGHYMGTGPQRAADRPVIVQVLAPVLVCGISLHTRKQWGLRRMSGGGQGKASHHHPSKDRKADLRHTG